MINGGCYFDYMLPEEGMGLQGDGGKNADHAEKTVLRTEEGMKTARNYNKD